MIWSDWWSCHSFVILEDVHWWIQDIAKEGPVQNVFLHVDVNTGDFWTTILTWAVAIQCKIDPYCSYGVNKIQYTPQEDVSMLIWQIVILWFLRKNFDTNFQYITIRVTLWGHIFVSNYDIIILWSLILWRNILRRYSNTLETCKTFGGK